MVTYVRPKYLSKRAKLGRDYRFGAVSLNRDAPEPRTPTCNRCAVTIANQKNPCNKPDEERCAHCVKGHRSCELIPREFYGRYERLYELRDGYLAAVQAAANPRRDENVHTAAVVLARAQRAFTKSHQAFRLASARRGKQVNAITKNPTSSPDYLRLILAEQRTLVQQQHRMSDSLARIADSFDAIRTVMAAGAVAPINAAVGHVGGGANMGGTQVNDPDASDSDSPSWGGVSSSLEDSSSSEEGNEEDNGQEL